MGGPLDFVSPATAGHTYAPPEWPRVREPNEIEVTTAQGLCYRLRAGISLDFAGLAAVGNTYSPRGARAGSQTKSK